MMDFHILIVIACVFLASLFSLLFINKFFKRKTFEEIVAEKKAMTEKLYGQNKNVVKKPKKLQQLKKEQKREKKQRQKEQQRDNEKEFDDSDAPSDHASAEEEPPQGLSKTHVEFEPDPEIVTFTDNTESLSQPPLARGASNSDRENNQVNPPTKQPKSKKDKKSAKSGILVNKNEPVAVKETPKEETLNHFEAKPPKDVIELKKQEKESKTKEVKEEKVAAPQPPHSEKPHSEKTEKPNQSKKEKTNKKDKPVDQPAVESVNTAKELKQLDEKPLRQSSPKNQQQGSAKLNVKTKKQSKDTAATKELVVALDKLSENDTIGVSLLMNLFRRAELNRSEIQMLIDYLLNKQQDTPNTHSEWSDDVCQKLKRQLEEKERLLSEEQEASLGIQAKLRELRTEINTERAQMNANVKAYIEKIQSKEQELTAVNQELQTLNDKIALERQQFQAKLIREKQAASQDLLAQLQMMQSELAHKDKCITELTCMMNANQQAVEDSQQKTSELIQTQVQQIRALEQQRDELEQLSNNRVFEIEQAKTMETENAEYKVEISNLQNALESTKTELLQAQGALESVTAELTKIRNVELAEKQNEIEALQSKNAELTLQVAMLSNKAEDQGKEYSSLKELLETLKAQVEEKEQELQAFNLRNIELMRDLKEAQSERNQHDQEHAELKESVEMLKTELAQKDQKISEAQNTAEGYKKKETELLQQLQEQKEKNNQQEQMLAAAQKSITTASVTTSTTATVASKDERQIRELFQRLYPHAAKACAPIALTLSFDEWIEQVVAAHIKQSAVTTTSSNKATQSNNGSSNHSLSNDHLHDSTSGSSEVEPADHNSGKGDSGEGDELKNFIEKASCLKTDLENKIREPDEKWTNISNTQDEQIKSLQHSNGDQDI